MTIRVLGGVKFVMCACFIALLASIAVVQADGAASTSEQLTTSNLLARDVAAVKPDIASIGLSQATVQ